MIPPAHTTAGVCWRHFCTKSLGGVPAWGAAALADASPVQTRCAGYHTSAVLRVVATAPASSAVLQRPLHRRTWPAPTCRLALTPVAPSAVEGGGGSTTSGPASAVTAGNAPIAGGLRSGDGGIPWKVQWQLPGDSTLVPVAVSGKTQQQPSAQFEWTPFDRAASVRAAALDASGWQADVFQERYDNLAAVLPDLPSMLPSFSSAQLLAALADPQIAAAKVVSLKTALPSTDVGMLLLHHPPFLDVAVGVDTLLAGVEHAQRVLGGRAVAEEVLQWYPPLMDPAILDASIAQLRRLVPQLARQCLPSDCGRAGTGYGAGAADGAVRHGRGMGGAGGGGGDARQLVHLLGIVMQSEGTVGRAKDHSGGSMWWGCS